MIKIKESKQYSVAPGLHYGPTHAAHISRATAKALCGMYPLPRMGEETVCAVKIHSWGRSCLYVANMSGGFMVQSSQVAIDAWPDTFGIELQRVEVAA